MSVIVLSFNENQNVLNVSNAYIHDIQTNRHAKYNTRIFFCKFSLRTHQSCIYAALEQGCRVTTNQPKVTQRNQQINE